MTFQHHLWEDWPEKYAPNRGENQPAGYALPDATQRLAAMADELHRTAAQYDIDVVGKNLFSREERMRIISHMHHLSRVVRDFAFDVDDRTRGA